MTQRNLFKLFRAGPMIILATLLVSGLTAQMGGGNGGHGGNGGGHGGGHNGGGHNGGGMMHDSLEVVTLSGYVSIDTNDTGYHSDSTFYCNNHNDNGSGNHDNGQGAQNMQNSGIQMKNYATNDGHRDEDDSTFACLVYSIDTDDDGINNYVLNFGPPWHTPADSTLSRPEAGDYITITGYLMTESMMWDLDMVIVTELNGQVWREFPGPAGNPGSDEPEMIQVRIGRHGNYPNPFNPSTIINFEVLISSEVHVTVHDILGRHVASLMKNYATPGVYSVTWNGQNDANVPVSSGLYLYRINTGTNSVTKLINFIK